MKSKFMYVGIRVTDLERSIDFYTRLKSRIDIYSYAERLADRLRICFLYSASSLHVIGSRAPAASGYGEQSSHREYGLEKSHATIRTEAPKR